MAQRKYEKRLKEKPKMIKFRASVKQHVLHFLVQDWLPYLKTITTDNGKVFAEHERIAEILGIDLI